VARIRTIKPDFFTSDTVAELSLRARLTWIGLWTYCDDSGRCRDNVKLIKAAVWPLDDVSLSNIEKDLTDLLACGLVYRYEVDSKGYLQITNWEEHQRISHPTESKIPDPPPGKGPGPGRGGNPDDSGINPESSGAARDMSGAARPGKEQGTGNREQGRERTPALPLGCVLPRPDLFAEFWITYPRRIDKRAAERAWKAALKRGHHDGAIILAARRYAKEKVGTDPKFIKHPTTWLNADAFENEPEPLRLVSNGHQPWQDQPPEAYEGSI
jgi:hypothetical protein